MRSQKSQISLLRKQVNNISSQLEKAKIADYIGLMENPVRLLIFNFMGGLARGFGMAVGFTLLGALALLILQRLVLLNLPVIGGGIAEIVKLVQDNMK